MDIPVLLRKNAIHPLRVHETVSLHTTVRLQTEAVLEGLHLLDRDILRDMHATRLQLCGGSKVAALLVVTIASHALATLTPLNVSSSLPDGCNIDRHLRGVV